VVVEFKLTDKEVKRYRDWAEKHEKECPITNPGAIGGKITFCFTGTSLGVLSRVTCACGEGVLLTDVSEF
jgi:hypothetical protein